MVEKITLYTAKICPYAQRAELALAETNAPHEQYQIDLQNKPEWYAPKVNPASKVPAIAYGGPPVPPDQPSPESVKIAESLVIVEFIADLYPDSKLLPKDPVLRAKARFFIDAVGTKLTPAWHAFLSKGGEPDALFKAIEAIQALLAPNAKYAVNDDFTIADIAIAPFLGRLYLSLQNDIGAYDEGQGLKVYEELQGPKYSKFNAYFEAIKARDSFKKTFAEDLIKTVFTKRFGALRAEKQAA